MHIDGSELVRIHNLPPFTIGTDTYIIGSVMPIQVLRDALPANVLIAYLVSGRIRPANPAASRYPHGGMDANIAAVWALDHSPTGIAFNAPLAHQPANTSTTVAAVEAMVDTADSSDDDVEYQTFDASSFDEEPDLIAVDAVTIEKEPVKRRPGRPRKNQQ